MKRMLVLMLALTMTLSLLTACGGQTESTGSTPEDAQAN